MLLPVLARPTLVFALLGAVVALWLAWKSVAYPLALSNVPTIVEAITGSNPLPKGGVTFLFAAWIAVAVAFAVMRGTHRTASAALTTAPVVLSVVLLALMLLRLGASPAAEYGSVKLQHYVADNLIFMLGAVFVGCRRKDLRLFLSVTLAVAAGQALLLLVNYLGGSYHSTLENRLSLSAQEYPIYLARQSADGLIIAVYAVLTATRSWARLGMTALIPLLAVALLAAGSRGPVVALLLSVIAFVALTSTNRRARRRLLQAGAGLLGAAVVVPLVLPTSTLGRAISAIAGGAGGLSTNGRSGLWSQAYDVFATHPLLGSGWGGLAAINPTEPYPHNVLLEVAAELGALGALALIALIASSLSKLFAVWRASDGTDKLDAMVIVTLLLGAIVNALFSGAIQDNKEIWVWAGAAAAMSARVALRRRTGAAGLLGPQIAPGLSNRRRLRRHGPSAA